LAGEPASAADGPDPALIAGAIALLGEHLEVTLEAGDTLFLRRASLVRARGDFDHEMVRIAAQTVSVFAVFTGEVPWANRFTARDGPLTLTATRDFHGTVVALPVSAGVPLRLQPARYLGHSGEIRFRMRRSAKREFWVMTEAEGDGTVYIKVPGTARIETLAAEGEIVDTNYIAAVAGSFAAHGKVFSAKKVVATGEQENVRLSGSGVYVLQSENPDDGGGSASGGGILNSLFQLLPF